MSTKLTLSQAIEGMLLYKRASGKSPNTVENYRVQLEKLEAFFPDDPPLGSITRDQLVSFFAWLQDGYVCKLAKLSQKSILNIHTALSALWAWAVEIEMVEKNIIRSIKVDKPNDPVINPFTKEEIAALLKACDRTVAWKGRPQTAARRATADRDRAVILLLLDTGLRATELCDITLADINLGSNSIEVLGKGGKRRIVLFGRRTARVLWKYITPKLNSSSDKDKTYLFTVGDQDAPRQMDRYVLCRLLQRLSERAGVSNVHPHRFRHTFAITYLRNKGDLFTLQALLGHSDLEMVKRYVCIAQTDCVEAHQRAGPVDNWKL